MKKLIAKTAILICIAFGVNAQTLKQTIRGRVVDIDMQTPLIGVTVYIDGSDPIIGTVTDQDGNFTFQELPVGRYKIIANYVGYEPKMSPEILLGAGKEVVLELDMTESLTTLNEVVVKARKNKSEALNDMAAVSARSFTVEETRRYAGSLGDPARMVASYAGVMGDPDGNNEIIVRGNSPRGMQWRIEGVPVANPNHFANEGATGGPISILNSTTLENSDFFTSAFPAEYGNAFSGIFDINLRKGNNQKSEYTIQAGLIGVDLTAEGPIAGSGASYLANYRYSSLALMNKIGMKIVGDAIPEFQDATIHANLPTEHFGTFQLFGVGGLSTISFDDEDYKEDFGSDMGLLGISNLLPISNKTYLKTSLSYNGTASDWNYFELDEEINSFIRRGNDKLFYNTYRISIDATHKFSAKHTLKTGIATSLLNYNLLMDYYDEDLEQMVLAVSDNGQSQNANYYINWKFRPVSSLTFNSGIHLNYFHLNQNYSVEPRLGVKWQFRPRQAISAGFGVHSRSENISIYMAKEYMDDGSVVQHNRDLDFIKARHYVIGYENLLTKNLFLKIEMYYQDLYNVPIEDDPNSAYSILNAYTGYMTMKMVNEGTGSNLGVEITLEKYFNNNYYFLITGSYFDSKYVAGDGIERNTRFNNRHITNVLVGKEFPMGKLKNSTLAFNLQGTYAGGQWFSPIDVEQSREKGYTVRPAETAFSKQREDYLRMDLKCSLRRNKKQTTRVWELDIQNVTNTSNVTGDYWNDDEQQIETWTQLGILPVLNYRIEF